jgi:hypothetical protein
LFVFAFIVKRLQGRHLGPTTMICLERTSSGLDSHNDRLWNVSAPPDELRDLRALRHKPFRTGGGRRAEKPAGRYRKEIRICEREGKSLAADHDIEVECELRARDQPRRRAGEPRLTLPKLIDGRDFAFEPGGALDPPHQPNLRGLLSTRGAFGNVSQREGSRMRRREFIAGLGGAVAWPVVARAQQPERMRRIGVLMGLNENDPVAKALLSAFTQALAGLGWTRWP